MKCTTRSEEETFALARDFSQRLKPGDVLALEGELGAGKTRFVQGLAQGLGVPHAVFVRSPTFALLNQYDGGRLTFFHFDFYRIETSSAFEELGFEEYFDGDGVCAIEWADRFPKAVPARAMHLRFSIVDAWTRTIEWEE